MYRYKISLTFCLIVYLQQLNAQTLHFSGYLGGTDSDQIRDVTSDQYGNIYVTGGTTSPDFPVTAGAYQTIHNPGTPDNLSISPFDVFVTKLDPDGHIIWSTFIGGRNYDRAYGIEVDSMGYVYVAGRAGDGFPVTNGSFQTTFQGGEEAAFYGPQDGFVLKIEPDGSDLVWASYFGSNDISIVRDLAIDADGNVYLVSGYAAGTFTPEVGNKFINTPLGNNDAVLAKISADGSSVIWATFLGGSGWESNENSVRMGPTGDPYILFTTESSGIATSGSYDQSYAGNQDFFVSRVNASTGEVIWGTYIGGSDNESTETHEFAVDHHGNAYVSGPTKSFDYPVTPGAFQQTFIGPAGFNDIVISKISPDGTQLLASTYIGGNGTDRSEGIDVDDQERVYITGTTTSTNFPITANAFQTNLNGNRDAFAVVTSADLKSIDYSTYLGGTGVDYGRSADVDVFGNFILGGEASAAGIPITGGGFPFAGGNQDAMIAKFQSDTTTQIETIGYSHLFNLFPNPGSEELFIDLVKISNHVQLKIYSNPGQLIAEYSFTEIRTINLELGYLNAGVYYIQLLIDGNKAEHFKWIKQ